MAWKYIDVIYEDLVQEFYANLEVVKNSVDNGIALRSLVCDKMVMVSKLHLCEWFSIPEGEVRLSGKGNDTEHGDEESDSEATNEKIE